MMKVNYIYWQQIAGLLLYVCIACAAIFIARPPYIVSILCVLAPGAFFTWRLTGGARKKILLFAAVSTILFAIPVELSARLANAWDVASIFPRLFGVAPLENLVYAFINFWWGISFYKAFMHFEAETKPISSRFKFLIGLYVIFSGLLYGLYFLNPNYVALNYAALAIPILVIPFICIFRKRLALLKSALLPTAFFAIVFFIYECVSLAIGSWWWPGTYLLPLKIGGAVFPLDDVFIWYFLSTPALIGGYAYFVDGE